MNTREITLEKSQNQRYDFMDVAKGIGILFVIFSHVNYTPSLSTIVYSFHMPLFFILSGMLFRPDKYSTLRIFIKRKTQTLICPYVLFYLISILFRLAVSILSDIENFHAAKFITYFLQMFLSQGSGKLSNPPLWFVTCLFVVEIIYYYISKLKKPLIIIISTLLTFSGWFIESDLIPFENKLLPWSIDSALFAIGFFALGNLMSDYICTTVKNNGNNRRKNVVCISVFLLVTVILIPCALYNGKVSLGSKILNNGFLLYLTGILGFIGILALSVCFEKSRFLKYCGKNSFQIMSIHYLIRDFIVGVCAFLNIPIYDKTIFAETILPVVIVTCLSLIFTFCYNKIKFTLQRLNDKKV